MLSMFSLTGRVALVTGGGRGIGKAIALGFAAANADVVVAARTAAEIEKTAEEIRAVGRRALAIVCDVTDGTQVTGMAGKCLEEFGRIDILVNNAGGGPKRPALQQSERYWDAIMRLNLTSTLLCSKAVAEPMIRQGKGSIINIASAIGRGNMLDYSAYAVSKDAVISLTHRLSLEWAQYHIRVNAIAPGFFMTEQNRFFLIDPATGSLTKRAQTIVANTPMGRFGRPEELIGTTLWLLSDGASFVHGAVIPVDGGFSAFGGV